MRNDCTQAQRSRPLQLACEALDAPRAQNGIGRGVIDEVAIMRHERFESITRDCILEATDMLVCERWLTPLSRSIGKDLHSRLPQLDVTPACGDAPAPSR